MFEWDDATNKLSMKAGRDEPWIFHTPPPSQADCTWTYCSTCFDRWVNKSKVNRSFVTFRDKASQAPMRQLLYVLARRGRFASDNPIRPL